MKIPRRRADHGSMDCQACGSSTPKRSPMQKYCPDCSEIKDRERKARHASINGKRLYDERRTQFSAQGVSLSATEQLDIASSAPPMPPMAWYVRVGVPFSWAGSKNHIFSSTARGHVFMRDESRYMRAHISGRVAEATAEIKVAQNKLWLDIFVQKTKQNGDAVNFVDLVCDAVKDAVPLDDRWFSLRCVDWQIAKTDPMIFIGIGQESVTDVQACSSCGRLLTFDNFQKHRGLPNGVGRNCRECMAVRGRKPRRPSYPREGVFA